jgi:hypothetical protein
LSDTGTCYPAHEEIRQIRKMGMTFAGYGTLGKAAGLKLINVKIAVPHVRTGENEVK